MTYKQNPKLSSQGEKPGHKIHVAIGEVFDLEISTPPTKDGKRVFLAIWFSIVFILAIGGGLYIFS